MRPPINPIRQPQLFELTPDEREQLLAPDRREPCRVLLVQLLQTVIQAETTTRNNHERQDHSEAS